MLAILSRKKCQQVWVGKYTDSVKSEQNVSKFEPEKNGGKF